MLIVVVIHTIFHKEDNFASIFSVINLLIYLHLDKVVFEIVQAPTFRNWFD
jgi:hypothetical protein